MCVILYKPIGTEAIKKKYLETATDVNRDGWGLLVRDHEGNIKVEKGFDTKLFVDLGSSYGKEYDVVAHARIATGGQINVANLHPFAVYDDPTIVYNKGKIAATEPTNWLFHNGMVTVKEWDKNMSDTWHLARMWEALYGPNLKERLRVKIWRRRQKYVLGLYNKFVVVNKERVSIINPAGGLWHEGVWHSNRTAIESPYACWGAYGTVGDDDLEAGNGIWVKQADNTWKLEDMADYFKKERIDERQRTKEKPTISWSRPKELAADPSAVNCGGEEFLDQKEIPGISGSGYDKEDVELVNLDSFAPKYTKFVYEDEITQQNLVHGQVDEWMRQSNVEDIEETLYNYDGRTTARAIRYLLKKTNMI
jgi:hypothetical protein